MRRFSLAIGVLGLGVSLAGAQATTWAIDPAHSAVEFGIRHMGLSTVHGHFGNVKGTIVFDEANVSKSSVNVTIDVTTVDTGNSARDNHLKTDAFFDIAHFPSATFVSTSVSQNGSHLTVNGNLTLRGVSKPVVLDAVPSGAPVQSAMDHKMHVGYSATTAVKRLDFGIGIGFSAAALGEDVPLTIDLEAVKQ